MKSSIHLQILKNSGWLILEKVTRGLLILLVGAWVAKHLGPSQFGELGYVLAYLAFFQAITNLGLDSIVINEISKLSAKKELLNNENRNDGEIIGTTAALRIITGVICWPLSIIIMHIIYPDNISIVLMTSILGSTLILQATETIDLWFQSQSKNQKTVISKLIAYSISNTLKIIFILLQLPVFYFAIAMLIESLFLSTTLIYHLNKYPCKNKIKIKIAHAGIFLLKKSWPMMISGVLVVFYMKVDQILVKNFWGSEELGVYLACITITTMGYIIPTILATSTMPLLFRKKEEHYLQYLRILKYIYFIMLLLGLTTSILLSIFAENLIHIIYNEKYNEGADALEIYAFSCIPVFIGIVHGIWITNTNRQIIQLYRSLAGGIFVIILCILLIPKYGIVGASISSLIGFIISDLIVPIIFNKRLFLMIIKS